MFDKLSMVNFLIDMKTIVIASDSFKGTLSSLDICHLFEGELSKRSDISPIYFPIADGGEGSLTAISTILEGRYVSLFVDDLYLERREVKFFIDNDNNAYIETASCVGLTLARKDNDPGKVSTYGLGEQILKAIDLGVKNIYVFLGGSASNDGGVGLASALGTKFYDIDDEEFIPNGLTLRYIEKIDNSKTKELLKGINIIALSDVKSPFFGVEGAAFKFAPQKGARKEEVILLDEGLKHLSTVINKDLNVDISNVPGSGAAGGLGGGLLAFCSAKICSGINTILDLIGFDQAIAKADLVISGEGKFDKQTYDGKVIDGVAKRCMKANKPLSIIVGISEASLDDIRKTYPCITNIYETNERHRPFEEVKKSAKEDYVVQIKKLLSNL